MGIWKEVRRSDDDDDGAAKTRSRGSGSDMRCTDCCKVCYATLRRCVVSRKSGLGLLTGPLRMCNLSSCSLCIIIMSCDDGLMMTREM